MWGFVIALISGALMSVQGVFNTAVTKQTSIWVAAGWVQLLPDHVAYNRTAGDRRPVPGGA